VPEGTPHVVIVGGGFGGLNAARALADAPARVTLIDRSNHHLFQPLLYQVATAALSPGDIASPIRWILRRQRNCRVLLAEARGLEAPERRLLLDEGALPFDFLILAAGAAQAYFGHDEWATHAPSLKTLDDALAIRRRLLLAFERAEREERAEVRRRLLTFIIVGGGPTGVELAGALAEIARHALAHEFRSIDPAAARIILVEAGPTLLPTFPPRLRDSARRTLEALGVEVHMGQAVTEVGPWGAALAGERIEAASVVWAAGVAATPLGRETRAPLDRVGRVLVAPDLSIPGHPEIFAVGDMAAFLHQDGKPLPGVAQVAIQEGRHAARQIERSLRGLPRETFHYRDLGNMATVGRGSAIADLGWVQLAGLPGWLAWLFLHLVYLIGFRNRLIVMVQWAWSYLTYQRNVRLITNPHP
jgi:NADH:ubiquinone reductase (H+-translocating)